MMLTIPISQARAQLSRLLKKIRKNPSLAYKITINDVVVGELRAPYAQGSTTQAGTALSKLAKVAESEQELARSSSNVSTQHNSYLYGKERKLPAKKAN